MKTFRVGSVCIKGREWEENGHNCVTSLKIDSYREKYYITENSKIKWPHAQFCLTLGILEDFLSQAIVPNVISKSMNS